MPFTESLGNFCQNSKIETLSNCSKQKLYDFDYVWTFAFQFLQIHPQTAQVGNRPPTVYLQLQLLWPLRSTQLPTVHQGKINTTKDFSFLLCESLSFSPGFCRFNQLKLKTFKDLNLHRNVWILSSQLAKNWQ